MPVIQNEPGLALDSILVATDFTPESEKALAYARELAHQFASRLTIAHVLDLSAVVPSDFGVVAIPITEMRHDTAENMIRTLDGLGAEGIPAQGKTIESHNPARAIVKLSAEIEADLIIVGTHNRHGLSKLILGSCSEEIVRSARCPVLVIGPHMAEKPLDLDFRTVVFATDLKDDAVEKAAVALTFTKDSIANVHVVHVIEDQMESFADAFRQHARAECTLSKLIPDSAYSWCTPKPSVAFGNIDREILKVAKNTHADLIVLGAHHGSRYLTRIWDSVVEEVVADAACPVLTICTN